MIPFVLLGLVLLAMSRASDEAPPDDAPDDATTSNGTVDDREMKPHSMVTRSISQVRQEAMVEQFQNTTLANNRPEMTRVALPRARAVIQNALNNASNPDPAPRASSGAATTDTVGLRPRTAARIR